MSKTNSVFETKVVNSSWKRRSRTALPSELRKGRIAEVYELEKPYPGARDGFCIVLSQTWTPYGWHLTNSEWEISHVSTARYGGFKIPLLGWVGTHKGLKVIVYNNANE